MHGQGLPESRHWGGTQSSPRPGLVRPVSRIERLLPLYFALSEDLSGVRDDMSGGCRIRSAEGIAWRADSSGLSLEMPDRRVTLRHNLPASIGLRALLGHSLRVTLVEETSPAGVPSQTLTLSAPGQVWLVARLGPVRGVVHSIGGTQIHASLSQRPDGPLVVGTRDLQALVNPGGHVWLPGSRASLVVEFVARVSSDTAAYVVAEESIYAA